MTTDSEQQDTTDQVAVIRQIEAVMMVADEPMSVVALAGALDVPVGIVAGCLEQLVADYNGDHVGWSGASSYARSAVAGECMFDLATTTLCRRQCQLKHPPSYPRQPSKRLLSLPTNSLFRGGMCPPLER